MYKEKHKTMTTTKKVILSEVACIEEGLSKYGRRAYDTSLENGVQVTVLRGNNILKIDANGGQEKIATIEKTRTKVTQRVFSLK